MANNLDFQFGRGKGTIQHETSPERSPVFARGSSSRPHGSSGESSIHNVLFKNSAASVQTENPNLLDNDVEPQIVLNEMDELRSNNVQL